MAKLDPIESKNLQSGRIARLAVADSRMPLDAVSESANFHFDRIGAATLRKGTTILGNQISAGTDLLGLYEFRDSGAGTNNRLIAVNGSTVYYLSSGAWQTKRSVTTGSKARFSTFLDFVFMVNGADATAVWTGATGDSFSTSGNADGAPIGKFIENFRSRMWIAGNSSYPDRLYYSSVPSAEATPVITWDTSATTGDWINISPSDGENITALKRSKSYLLVFKNNHIYRVASINQTDPDPVIPVGTYSQESVVDAKDGTYFHHPSGFYKYSDGAAVEISKPIQDIVEAVTVANYSKVCGWTDGDHVYWAVGDVTIDGVTYANTVVRYTISSQVWTHYTYPTQFLVSAAYNDGSTLFRVVGDDDGNVLKVDVGTTDNGTPISYSLTHRWYTLDGLMQTRKTINKMMVSHIGGNGTKVLYQIQGDKENDWMKTIGQLGELDTSFSSAGIKARKCRFRIAGHSTGEPFIYEGFELTDVESEYLK